MKALSLCAFLFVSAIALSASAELPQLHQVDITSAKPAVEASQGDVVQIAVSYPVVPGKMIKNATVALNNGSLTKVAVVSANKVSPDGHVMRGEAEVRVYLQAAQKGKCVVSVTCTTDDGTSTTKKVDVVVQ